MAKTVNKKECNEIGCHLTVIGTHCDKHKKKSKSRRGANTAPYNKKIYVSQRAAVLSRDNKCWICGVNKATIVDHVDNNPNNNAPPNLKGACNPCNTRKGYYHNKAQRSIH
jgi:5-methylcytosine-specific restriction endonuclease McrA